MAGMQIALANQVRPKMLWAALGAIIGLVGICAFDWFYWGGTCFKWPGVFESVGCQNRDECSSPVSKAWELGTSEGQSRERLGDVIFAEGDVIEQARDHKYHGVVRGHLTDHARYWAYSPNTRTFLLYNGDGTVSFRLRDTGDSKTWRGDLNGTIYYLSMYYPCDRFDPR